MEEELEVSLQPHEQGPTSADCFATLQDGYNRLHANEIEDYELAEIIVTTVEFSPEVKKVISSGNIAKLKTSLKSDKYYEAKASKIRAELDPINERLTELHAQREALKQYDFVDLHFGLEDSLVFLDSIKVQLQEALDHLVEIITSMIEKEAALEQQRQDIWAMRPGIINLPLEKKRTTQEFEKVESETAILKQKAALRADTDELILCAGHMQKMLKRGAHEVVNANDRQILTEMMSKAGAWSQKIHVQADKKLYDDIAELDKARVPLESKLQSVETEQRNKKRAKENNPQLQSDKLTIALAAIFERIQDQLS